MLAPYRNVIDHCTNLVITYCGRVHNEIMIRKFMIIVDGFVIRSFESWWPRGQLSAGHVPCLGVSMTSLTTVCRPGQVSAVWVDRCVVFVAHQGPICRVLLPPGQSSGSYCAPARRRDIRAALTSLAVMKTLPFLSIYDRRYTRPNVLRVRTRPRRGQRRRQKRLIVLSSRHGTRDAQKNACDHANCR